MVAINEVTHSAMMFQTRCKLWSCPDCAKVNYDLWCFRLTYGAMGLMEAGSDIHLVTVTAHERHSVKRAVEVLPSGWDKLRKRWRRAGGKIEYALIPEVGKKGHFHVHIICNGAMGTRWWKDSARSCGFGYSNHESDRFISPARAGYYGGKYLSKQLTVGTYKRGFHRVRCSQGWPKLPALPRSEEWRFMPWPELVSIDQMYSRLVHNGYSVALADDRASWHFIQTGELTDGCQPLTMALPYSVPLGDKTDA